MPAGPDPPVSAPVEPRGEPAVGEPALAAALEQLAVPVFVTAAGGRVLWANGAARELLAWLGVEAVPGDGSLAHALGLEP
jgi:PAS domain-containing protein